MARERRVSKIEDRILAHLLASGERAMTEEVLRIQSGVGGNSFKEALIRLVRKGYAVKWKSEKSVNYLVAKEFSYSAYYEEVTTINPLYLAFGHSVETIIVRRSRPFIHLHDGPPAKPGENRYRENDQPGA